MRGVIWAIILVIYVAYSQYLITSYEEINTNLQLANDNLRNTCTTSSIKETTDYR